MLSYVCDWCGRQMKPKQRWIVGLAAQHRGATADRCEVAICDTWSALWARHPFAVHFCCEHHKDRYVRSIFAPFLEGEEVNAPAPISRKPGVAAAAVLPATKTAKKRRRKSRKTMEPSQFSEHDRLRARAWGIKLD
jgi:hypothetical protein